MRIVPTIIMAVLGAGGLALLAFGPRDTEKIPPHRVVVEYWEKWTGYEEQEMREIVDDFNAHEGAEKGIYVRYLSISNVNQKTLVATAGGAPPDIAGINDWQMAQFASLDAIEPLETMAAAHGINGHTYKKVYWDSLNYEGHLYGLVSTPASIGLLYNKRIFEENAEKLRASGLDPEGAPRTMEELDKYAAVLDVRDADGRVLRAGTLPMEPGWYLYYLPMWFGGNIWDEATHQFTLTDPRVVKAFDWIESYSRKLGAAATEDFRGSLGNFDSPQNGFMHGDVVMEMNGPWMANYIYHNNKAMSEVLWPRAQEMTKPLEERRKNYQWAVAAWPSADPSMKDVSYCTSDILVIPRGAAHAKEAFAFMAYVTRQDVMERLCMMHCKNSPLAAVSENFLEHHNNPYIDVFERLASSPNAQFAPRIPIIMEAKDVLDVAIQKIALMEVDPDTGKPFTAEKVLGQAQETLQARYELFMEKQRARRAEPEAGTGR